MSMDAIGIGLSGLRANQSALAVVSNNLANASTEGYSRKELPRETQLLEGRGYGVKTMLLRRTINEYLQRDVWAQQSAATGLETRRTYLNQVQDFHGDPSANSSISADINNLKTSFQSLSVRPEDTLQLNMTYTAAVRVAKRFNDFSEKITQMRNDVQAEMGQSIANINSLLKQIATFNQQIQSASGLGLSSADIADQRDLAVKNLAKEISISTYKRDDGTLQILSSTGNDLASTTAETLVFIPQTLGTGSYYPTSAGAVYINSNTGPNLTEETNLGGRLGQLINLRDETLPTYQAQIDELAHKLATRLSSQGLELFTNQDGTIPANTPSAYVGFSASLRVNPDITADKTLLRKGTGASSIVQNGGVDVIRRVLDYGFGNVAYQQALGSVDLRTTAPQVKIKGTEDIAALGGLDASSTNITSGSADTFTLTVGGTGPTTITIGGAHTATDLVNSINTAFSGLASLNSDGQLVLQSASTITIGAGTLGSAGLGDLGLTAGTYTQNLHSYLDLEPEARVVGGADVQALGTLANSTEINPGSADTFSIQLGSGTAVNITIGATDTAADLVTSINTSFPGLASIGAGGQLILSDNQAITIAAGTLGASGLAELGLTAGATSAVNPSFTIATGLNEATTIEITPTETATTLLAKLNAVTGVTASLDSSGFLKIIPTEGGNLSLIDGLGSPLAALGIARSEIEHAAFNTSSLGPNSDLDGRVLSSKTLFDYATQMVSVQSQDASITQTELDSANTFKSQLEMQFTNQSGVNVDEEMANLITLQTAYNASANAIRIAQKMLDQLTDLFRS